MCGRQQETKTNRPEPAGRGGEAFSLALEERVSYNWDVPLGERGFPGRGQEGLPMTTFARLPRSYPRTTPARLSPRYGTRLCSLLRLGLVCLLFLAVGMAPRSLTAQTFGELQAGNVNQDQLRGAPPPIIGGDTQAPGAVGLPPGAPQPPSPVDQAQRRAETMRQLQQLIEQRKRELETMSPEEREKRFAADREAAMEKRRQEQAQREELQRQRVIQNAQEDAAKAVAAAAAQEQASRLSTSSSRALIMELRPFHQEVRAGQRFVTEVSAYSESGFQFDRVDVRIAYSPLEVRPVRIFDYPLEEGLSAARPPTHNLGSGLLAYSAQLKRPIQGMEHFPLLYILWESVGVSPNVQLSLGRFGLPGSMNSALWRGDKNLTSSEGMTGAACVNAGITIVPRDEKKSPGLQLITGPRGSRFAGAENEVGLALLKPETPPAPGEDFLMEVRLDNPSGAAFDQVRLAIAFDPQKAEVVDWDKGGWIRTGVNVYDAHAHASFPFNLHTANTVSNPLGRITYEMGAAALRPLPSGSLVAIHCRAKARGAAESFELVPESRNRDWYTDVRAGGHSILRRSGTETLVSQSR